MWREYQVYYVPTYSTYILHKVISLEHSLTSSLPVTCLFEIFNQHCWPRYRKTCNVSQQQPYGEKKARASNVVYINLSGSQEVKKNVNHVVCQSPEFQLLIHIQRLKASDLFVVEPDFTTFRQWAVISHTRSLRFARPEGSSIPTLNRNFVRQTSPSSRLLTVFQFQIHSFVSPSEKITKMCIEF